MADNLAASHGFPSERSLGDDRQPARPSTGPFGRGPKIKRDADELLEPVLRTVVAELKASQPDRAVNASFALTEPVACDRSRIAQLFSKLLSNALIDGAVDQPARVEVKSGAGVFELSVANADKPIPPASLERLFEPFFRSTISDREGLGLYIAHQIATAHGGTLEVSSTSEETRFTFRMPLIQSPTQAYSS